MHPRSCRISFWISYRKRKSLAIILFVTIPIAVALFYYNDLFSNIEFRMTLFSLQTLNSVIPGIIPPDTIIISTTTTTTPTTTPFEIVVDMNDRFPSYQLATRNGSKPYTNGPQAKLIDSLHLYDK
jgi:hypothetical protein